MTRDPAQGAATAIVGESKAPEADGRITSIRPPRNDATRRALPRKCSSDGVGTWLPTLYPARLLAAAHAFARAARAARAIDSVATRSWTAAPRRDCYLGVALSSCPPAPRYKRPSAQTTANIGLRARRRLARVTADVSEQRRWWCRCFSSRTGSRQPSLRGTHSRLVAHRDDSAPRTGSPRDAVGASTSRQDSSSRTP